MDNEKLVSVTSCLARRPTPEARAFLKLASEKSWLKDVRGAATYYYAISIESDPSKTDEYSALVEKLFKDYSDVDFSGQKLVKSAEGKVSLSGRRVVVPGMKFRIGKQASEIIGQDVDGKQMKLSDYRGKVVVIDFWGDW